MSESVLVALQLVAVLLVADFLSGLMHWVQDRYFGPETPLLGLAIRRNMDHHANPSSFLANPWYVTVRSSLPVALAIALPIYALGYRGWWIGAVLGVAVTGNQLHKWAHMPSGAVPWLPRLLQRFKVIQTQRHHAGHHAGPRDRRYCVMTNALNPVLDATRFWRALEAVVFLVARRRPRPDVPRRSVDVRSQRTGPRWSAADRRVL
jgi:ubiquitin-conjugating enzyme E2 variant